jgi:hypothetical protein
LSSQVSHVNIYRMQTEGRIAETLLQDGRRAAHILCPQALIPAPGRYVTAHLRGSDSALAVPLFCSRSLEDGFLAAPAVPDAWAPGMLLHLRGPLGRGFRIPTSARRVALASFDASPERLMALLVVALAQAASVVLVCEHAPADLPLAVEVQPASALRDAIAWADYLALDAAREALPRLLRLPALDGLLKPASTAQVLVRTPVPCAGMAECAVCAVHVQGGWKLACREGPVFNLEDLH